MNGGKKKKKKYRQQILFAQAKFELDSFMSCLKSHLRLTKS